MSLKINSIDKTYRGIYAVGRSSTGDRAAMTGAGCRGTAAAAAVTVRAGREQGDAEHDDGHDDGSEQCDGRQLRAVDGVRGSRGRLQVPRAARGRRLVVGDARTIDHAVAYRPGGQTEALVTRTGEHAVVVTAAVVVRRRCPPSRVQCTGVRTARQMVQRRPRDLKLCLVRVNVAHEPDVHVTTAPPVLVPRRLATAGE